MADSVSEGHPKQRLLFFVVNGIDDPTERRFTDLVLQLAKTRQWVIAPPRVVELGDSYAIGGVIEVYSALPPWTLPSEIDLQHLNEVTAVIDTMAQFSLNTGLAIEFELDDCFVGAIEDGKLDRSLSEGLLGEWRRNLGIAATS
jgi:hypothetical protein